MEALQYDSFQYYTYDDYKEWDEQWELIDGIAYAMAPAPYPKHQEIIGNLHFELRLNFQCKNKQCKIYMAPVDWKVSDMTVVQSDLAIFCEKSSRQFFSETPPLVIEVLSKSTALKDVTTKYKLYEQERVNYYVIVEPNSQVADIFELVDDEYLLRKKATQKDSYTFTFSNNCSTKINFSNVFEEV